MVLIGLIIPFITGKGPPFIASVGSPELHGQTHFSDPLEPAVWARGMVDIVGSFVVSMCFFFGQNKTIYKELPQGFLYEYVFLNPIKNRNKHDEKWN